jgi:hypothetical protein
MFKIIAVVAMGIWGGIGFFDLGGEAYTLAALLLGIGALLDYSQRRTPARASAGASAIVPVFLYRAASRRLGPPRKPSPASS